MIFTSYTYVVFLAVSFGLYWTVKPGWRKPLLILASFIFYCSWKWQYGFLLAGLAVFNWGFGRWVACRQERAHWLWPGVIVNVGTLVYFKYTRFLILNISALMLRLGGESIQVPDILLPLGVSFFTFQGVAYLVDVATGEPPIRRFLDFLLYKSFWPQLIAGPIIRPGEIRDQIEQKRNWSSDNVAYGLKRILNGFLKKVVIADNIAPVVDLVFMSTAQPGSLDVLVGTVGFGLQIYFDFSAYSEIAIGTARLFGYVFPENFNWPYLAESPREFWSRWHMTLSRWIKDYVFTPLAMAFRAQRALIPIAALFAMTLCGLWHGAEWTFVIWGAWHGVFLVLGEVLLPRSRVKPALSHGKHISSFVGWVFTMFAVFSGWLIFRVQSLSQLGTFIKALGSGSLLKPQIVRENMVILVLLVFAGTALLHLAKIANLDSRIRLSGFLSVIRPVTDTFLYAMAVSVIIVADRGSKAFVYFQF